MAHPYESVRVNTEPLDAVGNTTKAVTKGFAIGSAALAALVLFDSYTTGLHDANANLGGAGAFDLSNAWVIAGLFIGGLMPFLFASLAMEAVGPAGGPGVPGGRGPVAGIPGVMGGTPQPPDARALDIVTRPAVP